MSFFAKGDFKIQDSWDSKKKSQKKPQKKQQKRPSSRSNSIENDKNLLFMNLGKNIAQPSLDMLDDQLSKKIIKQFESEHPPSTSKSQRKVQQQKLPPKQKSNIPNTNQSEDLVASMANRLKQIQKTCHNQRLQIKEKDQTIQKLKTQNAFLKGMKDDSASAYKQMDQLKNSNKQLEKKVQQMEAYLKQYGLKWVGHNIEGKLQHQKLKKDISKKFNYRLPSEIDFNTVKRRMQQLNSGLHAQGLGTQIYIDNGVHKFRQAQPLLVGFYGNGIAIKGFKFLPYTGKQAMRVLSDVLDGYFPYILKNKYPDGVFLKALDFIEKNYSENNEDQQFGSLLTAEEKQLRPPSKQQFLNKLPKQVIKNGKVIPIRDAIQQKLNGKQQGQNQQAQKSLQYEEIDGNLVFQTTIHKKLQIGEIAHSDVCTIKIRTDSSQIFILQLQNNEKMKVIYMWMKKVIKKPFKLMSNYPRKIHEQNEEQTLDQLGFCPNGMLQVHLQNK